MATERRITVRLDKKHVEYLEFARSQNPSMKKDSDLIRWLLKQEWDRHEAGKSKDQKLDRIEINTEPTPRIEMKVDAILDLMRGNTEGKSQISAAEIPGCLKRDK